MILREETHVHDTIREAGSLAAFHQLIAENDAQAQTIVAEKF